MLPSYSVKEQKNRAPHLKRIEAVFGEMEVKGVLPRHVRAFRDEVGQRKGRAWGKPALSIKSLSVLSHLFTSAKEWGIVDNNPCAGIMKPPRQVRTRLPSNEDFHAVRNQCSRALKVAMDLALLTGLRREDILRLDRDAMKTAGMRVKTRKTGAELLFAWTPALQQVVDRAWSIPPRVRRFLVCNRAGKAHTPDGFSTNWRKARQRAIESGELRESYRFHDIRAKSATDDCNIDRASRRLGHRSRQTTMNNYQRGPTKVDPLR